MVFDEVAEGRERQVGHALELGPLLGARAVVARRDLAVPVQHDALVVVVQDEEAVVLGADQAEGVVRTGDADDVVGAADLVAARSAVCVEVVADLVADTVAHDDMLLLLICWLLVGDDLDVGVDAVTHALRLGVGSPAALVDAALEAVQLAAVAELDYRLVAFGSLVAGHGADAGGVVGHVVYSISLLMTYP